ncbi:hypothetical protein GCM10009772_01700 [Pseudonocardia alni subsp. carboxydivorans]
MEQNSELAARIAKALAEVQAEFPDPPNAHEPLHVPAHVAARWQSAIAREAERRARNYDDGAPSTGDLDSIEPHREGTAEEDRDPRDDPGAGAARS